MSISAAVNVTPSGPAADAPVRVLAIDDEAFQLKLLTRQLARLSIDEVTACTDAAQALELVRAEPGRFGLICCDLQMPEMDGVEFVRHLGDLRYPGSVVLISGEDDRTLQAAERLARARSLRVLGALSKPVGGEQLRQVIAASAVPLNTPARRAPQRSYSAAEVREGIERNQLVNYYQPQVEMATGRIIGVETLVRWNHPQDGLVFPDRFVQVAEENGLIDNLTRAVLAGLNGALHQARAWQDAGMPLQVSVNVSMDNLTDHGFPGFVAEAVAEAGVPPSRLVLEVTETRLMKDPLATLDILTRLRLKRVRLSIDDFGTGHSSLSQLRDVPFDELKVDRGFVHNACRDEGLRAILQASLDMARQLGIRTVAEGIEDADDWRFLRDSRCDIAQGYFIARPMPAGAVHEWVESWEARRAGLCP